MCSATDLRAEALDGFVAGLCRGLVLALVVICVGGWCVVPLAPGCFW